MRFVLKVIGVLFPDPVQERISPVKRVIYDGLLEVILHDPGGGVYFQKLFRAGSIDHIRPENMQWTALEKISLRPVQHGDWKIRARVLEGDPHFGGTHSEIRLYPPQIYDIGWHAFGEWLEILGMGVLAFLGLCLAGIGYRLRRKARAG